MPMTANGRYGAQGVLESSVSTERLYFSSFASTNAGRFAAEENPRGVSEMAYLAPVTTLVSDLRL